MSPLPQNLQRALSQRFGDLSQIRAVGGGDTSAAVSVSTRRAGRLFVKYGAAPAGLTYAAEADGLTALREAAASAGVADRILVPEPLAVAAPTADAPGYLVLPWLERGGASEEGWPSFGESLAALHRHGSELGAVSTRGRYGWSRDNYLGPETQANKYADNWVDFYRERRLGAMADRMRARGRWLGKWDGPLAALLRGLDARLPADPPPAPLHGDLWGGNAVALANGRFALIDPAAYTGHHEVDLALTELFGGFPPAFYRGYYAVTPEAPDYAVRRDLYQLYYLLVHLGISMSYGARVESVLRRYG